MPKKSLVWELLIIEHFEPVGRNGYNLNRFMDRYNHIRFYYTHLTLEEDLIKHLWAMEGNIPQ